MINLTAPLAPRLSVISRVLAAAIGGYLIMLIASAAIAFLLPMDDRNAFLAAIESGFLVYTAAIIWVFAARTATRAWLGLFIVGVPLLLIDCLFYYQSTLL